jgi:hypothetical protein
MEKYHQKFCKKKTLSTVPRKRTTEKISVTDSTVHKKEIHKYHVLTEESSKKFPLEWKKPPKILLSLLVLQIAASETSIHIAT